MTRNWPLGAQVGGLLLGALLIVLATSFAVVLLTPSPEPRRMTVRDVAAALARPERARDLGIDIRASVDRPPGAESTLVSSALGKALGGKSTTWASWLEQPGQVAAADGQTVMTIAGQDTVVDARPGGFVLRSGSVATVAADAPLPLFVAAVRQPDGQWLVASPRRPFMEPWRQRMLMAFLLSACLLAPIGWWVARRLVRPIRELAAAADGIQLASPLAVPMGGPPEVRAVASAMQTMHQRLAAEAEERTRMFAAIAHDLKTPLTGIRIRAESVAEPLRTRIIDDVERVSTMTRQLLDYARGASAAVERQVIALHDLVRDIAEDFVARGLPVRVFGTVPAAIVLGDPQGLRGAIENLVDNAVRYGDGAELRLATDGDGATVEVRDNGPGVPADALGGIVEPFRRLEPSRSETTGGSGLGLAIVAAVAARHGGKLILGNRRKGGFSAKLRLPLHRG
ncbi:HAMP domain-containing histidine kinase [Sphingomonas sinipercae]|uniref:histidine kinase n=1 Tax=Sphingomonas sinipercae TaxID=2714944 RepID=A0A6G7ZPZ7_9SPHN|nr:HAMP domain-containing sensor histidine kinase [Sphingomonas sinipercae]QIL03005.1 HAMP domain-containing histidine kinase [Sphingomonas sinipercae]